MKLAGRRITNHPQYENANLRRKDWLANQINGKRTDEELHKIASDYFKADYWIVNWRTKDGIMSDGKTKVLDLIDVQMKQEGNWKSRKHLPNFCLGTLGLMENSNPYFHVAYNNGFFTVLQVRTAAQVAESKHSSGIPYIHQVKKADPKAGDTLCSLLEYLQYDRSDLARQTGKDIWNNHLPTIQKGRFFRYGSGCKPVHPQNV